MKQVNYLVCLLVVTAPAGLSAQEPEPEAAPEAVTETAAGTEAVAGAEAATEELTAASAAEGEAAAPVAPEPAVDDVAPEPPVEDDFDLLEAADDFMHSVRFHGFGSWTAGYTDKNHYLHLASPDGNWESVVAALDVSATPYENLTVKTQFSFAVENEELGIDLCLAFAEYAFFDELKLRVGQLNHPFGLYSQILDVGTLRPFAALPQSVYGPNGVTSEFFRGVGITGNIETDSDWGFAYDVYAGHVHVDLSDPHEQLEAIESESHGEEMEPGHEHEHEHSEGTVETKNSIGTRVTVTTPLEGLRFGVGGFTGDSTHHGETWVRRVAFAAHAEFAWEDLVVRSEYTRLQEIDDDGASLHVMDGFYVEATYFLVAELLQLAAQFQFCDMRGVDEHEEEEGSHTAEEEAAFEAAETAFGQHREVAVGVNLWLTGGLVLKFSYHRVFGNRYARPPDAALHNKILTSTMSYDTHAWLFGAAFSF